MGQTVGFKLLGFVYAFVWGGGALMQVEAFQKAVEADEVDAEIAYYVAFASGILFILERLMSMWEKKKKSDLELYAKRKEIDEKYKK